MHKATNIDIQCLRAIAVILVVLLHYRSSMPVPEWYSSTINSLSLWSGVDIFFAISGFLMFSSVRSSLGKEASRGEAAYAFLVKRCRRLVPALICAMIISILVAAISTNGAETESSIRGAIAATTGLSNFYWWACISGTIDQCGSPHYNGVTWSLSLEWQLYAVLFLAMSIPRSYRALTFATAISLIYTIFSYKYSDLAMFTRPLPFFLGAMVGWLYSSNKPKISAAMARSLLFLGVAICVMSQKYLTSSAMHLAIAAGSLLCITATSSGKVMNAGSMLSKSATWVGDRSYSIYLLHYPAMVASSSALRYIDKASDPLVGVIISATLILTTAHLSYKFVETRYSTPKQATSEVS